MTYAQALNAIPAEAYLSATFGHPGLGGFSEIHRAEDGRRWMIGNGTYQDTAPFTWTVKEID